MTGPEIAITFGIGCVLGLVVWSLLNLYAPRWSCRYLHKRLGFWRKPGSGLRSCKLCGRHWLKL